MIWFFSLEKASAGRCDSYHELFQYFRGQEKLKLEDTESAEAAGTSNMGIQALRKQQCLDLCKAHNYVVIEKSAI